MKLLITTILLFNHSLFASDLALMKPVEGAARALKSDNPDCMMVDQEFSRLLEWYEEATYANIRNMNNVTNVVDSWYRELRRWEGRTVQVNYGAFTNIGRSARTNDDNRRYFEREFNDIAYALYDLQLLVRDCLAPL